MNVSSDKADKIVADIMHGYYESDLKVSTSTQPITNAKQETTKSPEKPRKTS